MPDEEFDGEVSNRLSEANYVVMAQELLEGLKLPLASATNDQFHARNNTRGKPALALALLEIVGHVVPAASHVDQHIRVDQERVRHVTCPTHVVSYL